jgi:two-component system, OmpR family, response regulator QseB
MKVLLIEDSHALRNRLQEGLRRHGFVVEAAATCAEGRWAADELRADVIALDAHLPDGNGIELLRHLRASGLATPVLLLTALHSIDDRLQAFAAGADDYLTKPFDLRELAARLQALARRAGGVAQPTLVLGGLEVSMLRREATLFGQPLALRRREFALLVLLCQRAEQVVPREEIEAKLYAQAQELRSNSVEAAVSQLRKCLTREGAPSIVTVRGVGYRLDRPAVGQLALAAH